MEPKFENYLRKLIREQIDADNIMTYSEFESEYDGEICEKWAEVNKSWLLTHSGDDEKYDWREALIADFEEGGTGEGNFEACWEDEDEEFGYNACLKMVADEMGITVVPDIPGMEFSGDADFLSQDADSN